MSEDSSSKFEQDKEFMQALAKYEEMLTKGQSGYFDADQLADFAEYYASRGDYDKSGEVIKYALKVHPGSTEILVVKAHILIDLGKTDEAEEIAYGIAESYDRDVKLLKAELLLKKNKIEEADNLLSEMINEDNNNDKDSYLDVAYLYIDAEMPKKALPWFQKVAAQYPDDAEVRMDLADCYFQSEQIEKAVDIYNKLLDKDPYSTEYWYELGKLYYTSDDINKAMEAYEFVLTIDKNHIGTILMMAHCYFKLENYEKAAEYYLKYSEIDDKTEMPLFFVGLCYYTMEMYDKAIIYMNKALEKSDDISAEQIDIYTYIALSYSKMREPDQALHYIELAINLDEGCAESYVYQGAFLIEKGKKKKAADSFTKAILIDPENNKIKYDIGVAYFEAKMYKRALDFFDTVEVFESDFESTYMYQAYIYLLEENKMKFQTYFMKAIKSDPNKVDDFIKDLPEEDNQVKELLLHLKTNLMMD